MMIKPEPALNLPHLLETGGVLQLSGRDALAFAQAQFANDAASLADGHWQWSLWLSAKGRVLALFALVRIDAQRLVLWLPDVFAESFADALQRFPHRQLPMDRSAIQQQFLSNVARQDERSLKLTLTTGERTYFISPAEITHCTADDNYTELHVQDGRRFVSARTLKDYEDMLLPMGFLRVHRSALVNRAMITHVDGMHLVLRNSERVEMSRRRREEVLKVLAA